jgi:glycosyltransferase involved in cell wall biosynthesis
VKRLAVKTAYFLRRRWNERRLAATFLPSAEALEAQRAANRPGDPLISLLVPLFDTPIEFLEELVASVKVQTYSAWELCLADGSVDGNPARADLLQELAAGDPRFRVTVLSTNLGISGNTNAAIDLARGPFLALLDHDDLLPPHALHEVAKAFRETGADFVYTDEACFIGTPRRLRSVHFKPDFAPDTLRGNNYLCHLSAFRATLLDRVGRLDPACDGSQDYDLVLRLTEKAERVVHIPKVCYFWRVHPGSVSSDLDVKPYALAAARRALDAHLERTGLSGRAVDSSVASTYRIVRPAEGTPLVSVIMISEAAGARSFEGADEARLRATTSLPNLEVLSFHAAEGETRSSALGRAVRASKGAYLVFLDPELEPRSPDWIGEMVGFARRPDVAAVGARLLCAGGKVFGAGLVVQPGPRVLHASRGDSALYDGYMSRSTYAVDVTAVPLECMMVRRDLYLATEGIRDFDGMDAAALDLCLQLTRPFKPERSTQATDTMRWVVCTPYVEFAFRGRHRHGRRGDAGELSGRPTEADIRRLVERWPDLATFHDPFYNPNLNAARADFTVRPPSSEPEVDE